MIMHQRLCEIYLQIESDGEISSVASRFGALSTATKIVHLPNFAY